MILAIAMDLHTNLMLLVSSFSADVLEIYRTFAAAFVGSLVDD
jgi:hypothetical protein